MKNYLSFNQVCEILPDDYRIIEKEDRNIYKIGKNRASIAFVNSRVYDNYIYWFSIYVDNLREAGIEYICFCLGFSGIIILPMSIISKYIQYANHKMYPNGLRYYIRIREISGHYVLYQASRNHIDITEYYIPY